MFLVFQTWLPLPLFALWNCFNACVLLLNFFIAVNFFPTILAKYQIYFRLKITIFSFSFFQLLLQKEICSISVCFYLSRIPDYSTTMKSSLSFVILFLSELVCLSTSYQRFIQISDVHLVWKTFQIIWKLKHIPEC